MRTWARSGQARLRSLITVVTASGALLLGAALVAAPNASAADGTVSMAVGALNQSSLYVGDSAAVINDKSGLKASLPSFVRIAVLPADAGNATSLANQIGKGLDPESNQGLVVGVIVGRTFSAGSSRYCAGYAARQAKEAVADNADQLQAGGLHPDLTALINDFGQLVATGQTCESGTHNDTTNASGSGSSSSGWAWLIGILAVIGGGIGSLTFFRRRKNRRLMADARARIEPLYDRLAGEVNTVDPNGDAVARQAMSDASQRFTSVGSQLNTATSIAQLGAARKTVLEGLYAARTARAALGLDLGSPLPAIVDDSVQLTEPREVTVQGQTFQGQPSYAPGNPYYYGGGYGVPGGWYGTPFWETLLIGSVLTGGLGGWGWGGGGYNSGYDAGYQAGNDNAGDNAGGDWSGGAGSSGDWSGGAGSSGDWSGGAGSSGDWGGFGGGGGGGGFGGGDGGSW